MFQFIPKVRHRVDVRALCSSLKFYHSKFTKPCLCCDAGAGVHCVAGAGVHCDAGAGVHCDDGAGVRLVPLFQYRKV